MHQTKKGDQWHFGTKAHVGTDTKSRTVHSLATAAANEADIHSAAEVLHGEERTAHFDAGYTGAEKREDVAEKPPQAELHIAAKRGKTKAMPEGATNGSFKDWSIAKRKSEPESNTPSTS